jgi:hypothetical protein
LPGLGNPDRMLAESYGRSLEDIDANWSTSATASGNVHLSGLGERPQLTRKPITVGDKITIASGVASDAFEVVELDTIDGASIGLTGLRLQVVTARLESAPATETVRMIFAVETPAIAPKPNKEL